MPKSSHEPLRTCLGCMMRDVKLRMIRIAALDSAISVDAAARLGGRGGYLHQRAECLERFERSRVKEFRSLRRRISLEERREITRAVRERLVSKTSLD